MNHRTKVIVSTLPTHNKQYLKQPYRRFYRENSTDIVWTKINRAIILLDKGYRNFSAASTPRGISRRQRLQESFALWKEETFEVKRNYNSTYPQYDRSKSRDTYSSRPKYEMEFDMPLSRSPEHHHPSHYRSSDLLRHSEKSSHLHLDGYSKYHTIDDVRSSRDSYRGSYLDDENQGHPYRQEVEDEDLPDADDHIEEKSDRSDASYSPDVFFLEDEALPKSTQALRERMNGSLSSSIPLPQPLPAFDDRPIQLNNIVYPSSNHHSFILDASTDSMSGGRKVEREPSRGNAPIASDRSRDTGGIGKDESANRSKSSSGSEHPTAAMLAQRQQPVAPQSQPSDFQSSRQQLKNSLQNIFNRDVSSREDGLAEAFELSP
jgi:hypothetical protein